MTISNEAVEAAAEEIMSAAFGQELPEAPLDLARAALEAAAPIIRAEAAAEALREAADLIEPFSGIGLANGATRADIAAWLRARAAAVKGEG